MSDPRQIGINLIIYKSVCIPHFRIIKCIVLPSVSLRNESRGKFFPALGINVPQTKGPLEDTKRRSSDEVRVSTLTALPVNNEVSKNHPTDSEPDYT